MGNLSREIETIKNGNSRTENISEIKNSLDGINSRLEKTEERIG